MPIFVTQGRYTREAIRGTIVKPEERSDAVARLRGTAGGRLTSYYLTFGDEAPSETQMVATPLTGGVGGGATDPRTTPALTSVEAKGAFAAPSELAPGFKSAGGA